jgi:hypothetical protein
VPVNVKGIQGELVRRAKADAIIRGQSLWEWVEEAMKDRLENGRGKTDGGDVTCRGTTGGPLDCTCTFGVQAEKPRLAHDPKTCRVSQDTGS